MKTQLFRISDRQTGKPGGKRFHAILVVTILGQLALMAGCPQSKSPSNAPGTQASKPDPQPASTTQGSSTKQNPASSNLSTPVGTIRPDLEPFHKLIREKLTGPARVQLQNYLTAHLNDAQATFLFGLTYWREQKYSEAIQYFDTALQLEPQFYLTHHFLGWSLYRMGDLARSRQAFEAFLMHQPKEPDSLFALGLIELDEDNLDQAEMQFTRSIEILHAGSKSADVKALAKAHAQLGEVFSRRDELEKARSELKLATDLYPDAYEAHYKLYRVQVRMGNDDDAQRTHQKYLAAKARVRPGAVSQNEHDRPSND